MRVVAGSARGLRLESPEGDELRPTADRVREAVFNALFSLGGVAGWTVVDLFAGTGAMGIEALSRGATHCTFVERSRSARELIAVNLESTGLADRSSILGADAARWRGRADLVIADPPYAFDHWERLLAGIEADCAVLESDRPVPLGPPWRNVRQKSYGGTVVTFASRGSPQTSGDSG